MPVEPSAPPAALSAARSVRPGASALVAAVLLALTATLLPSGGPVRAGVEVPSPAQVRAQRQEAAQLQELAGTRAARTVDARTRLADLAEEAGAALDAYTTALAQSRKAHAEELAARARHDEAVRVVRIERTNLGRFASATYRNGGGAGGQLAVINALLAADNITDMGRISADLQWVGTQQSFSVDRLIAAERDARGTERAAEAASERATAARERAEAAKVRADALVAQQRALVAELARQAAATRRAAQAAQREAGQMAERLAEARRIAAQRRIEAARARAAALRRNQVVQVVVPAGAGCQGGDVSSYPNGAIPVQSLCPLWGADWHVLRADAAAGFNAMSKAYAQQFGRPIMVTDSYRTYEAQVACRAQKGNLCADPGTSNHGWGTAVDLGDGVQSFTSDTHAWLKANAPRFGWFHPSWAEPGGSKPEPWHWEFAG